MHAQCHLGAGTRWMIVMKLLPFPRGSIQGERCSRGRAQRDAYQCNTRWCACMGMQDCKGHAASSLIHPSLTVNPARDLSHACSYIYR